MKFITRDSALVTATFLAAAGLFLITNFGLVQTAYPDISPLLKSRIELWTGIVGFVAGWLKMSPLALSPTNTMAGNADPSRTVNPLDQSPKPDDNPEDK